MNSLENNASAIHKVSLTLWRSLSENNITYIIYQLNYSIHQTVLTLVSRLKYHVRISTKLFRVLQMSHIICSLCEIRLINRCVQLAYCRIRQSVSLTRLQTPLKNTIHREHHSRVQMIALMNVLQYNVWRAVRIEKFIENKLRKR